MRFRSLEHPKKSHGEQLFILSSSPSVLPNVYSGVDSPGQLLCSLQSLLRKSGCDVFFVLFMSFHPQTRNFTEVSVHITTC